MPTNLLPHQPSTKEEKVVEDAIAQGIKRYFDARRANIPKFVRSYFLYPGCWHTNRHAFGFDLLRAPLNLIWAPCYVFIVIVLFVAKYVGFKRGDIWASKIPGGMTTRVQKYVNSRLHSELINPEALQTCIIEELEQLVGKPEHHADVTERLKLIVNDAMKQLMLTRTASADITNTIFSTAIGALIFKKFTPGGFGIGILLAAYWAKEHAKQSFFLGSVVGGWYYAVFPPKADSFQLGVSIGIAMLMLSVFASFSGLITDPVQSHLRLHHRRLRRMLNQMEKDLIARSSNKFKPLDPYVARILELFDTLKAQVSL